jgi:hypothetical protein
MAEDKKTRGSGKNSKKKVSKKTQSKKASSKKTPAKNKKNNEEKKLENKKTENNQIKEKTNEKTNETNPTKDKSNENKILKYTLIISGLIILLVIGFAFYINSLKSFDYKGVEFKTISYGDLILYQTTFPVMHEGKLTPFNAYFRTKPSKLERIDFPEENFTAMKYTVLNFDEEIECDGDDVIAIANMRQIHDAIGARIMTDENATCDEEGRYAYLDIKSSDKTQIIQTGKNCYDLEFTDCEILPVTEKYLAELLSEFLKEE